MKSFLYKTPTSFIFKFCEVALSIVALLNILLFPLEFLPTSFFEKYGQYFEVILIILPVFALITSLIFCLVWHKREKSTSINNTLYHFLLQSIIRYWLSFSIATYGFAKILKTQFQTAEYLLDAPLGSVHGMGLTWYYFGYSYPMAVFIALCQVGGATLLLYRRTTLLGSLTLLPVMVNILLINVFYNIGIGAFLNSITYLIALFFLLQLEKRRLKILIWGVVENLKLIPIKSNFAKQILRIMPIIIAFFSLKVLISIRPNDQSIKGTWIVENLIRNNQSQSPTAWLKDKRAWSRVYFAGNEGCAFSPNPYRFDFNESLVGSYKFDSLHNTLQIVFYPTDTVQATIKNRSSENMYFQGIIGGDTLEMKLRRMRR